MFMKRRQFIHTALAAIPAVAIPRFASAAETAAPLADIEALTSDRKEILLQGADVRDFAASLRCELLLRSNLAIWWCHPAAARHPCTDREGDELIDDEAHTPDLGTPAHEIQRAV